MQLQLKAIVLWSRDENHDPRVIAFASGLVNVITGGSKTGKSAIIPIVDYCLGSDKCTIPVGPIRDCCAWFGVVMESALGQHLFARREPGEQQGTGDMFIMESAAIAIPKTISKNATVDGLKEHLNDISGLTRLQFGEESATGGSRDRPSFRDLTSFLFQPQNVIANPAVLFYKADSQDHRDKLRTIFPFVLGAVTPEILALQHEARQLQSELRRKEREYANVAAVSARWHAEMRARVVTARELGLIDESIPETQTPSEMIEVLTRVTVASSRPGRVRLQTITDGVAELLDLEREESKVSVELAELRQRYSEMSRLQQSASTYSQALEVKLDRLSLADWMLTLPIGDRGCPVCGTSQAENREEVDNLTAAMRRVEEEFTGLSRTPASFDREQQRVREDIARAAEQLDAIQIRRRSLTRRSREAREQQYTEQRVDEFVGSLKQALETFSRLGVDGDLQNEIASLRERLNEIRKKIAERDVQIAIDRALARFSLLAQRIVPRMDVERADDALKLSIADLTLKVLGGNREDYLWEIGSGANWVAYHVATIVALHQLFLSLPHSPVPSFCILDQPSQVYFPRPSLKQAARSQKNLNPSDEDLVAVRMIFNTLSESVIEANAAWQVIVLDHADEAVWGSLPGINLVEVWRDGEKLVPAHWVAH